jgi:DNA sulfur modification protein DndD
VRFLKLETKNFRQYRDLNIDLVGETNFSIIQANIGIGKTTLTNAILWCLYGFEQLDKKKEQEPIPNETAVKAAKGQTVEVVVTLKLELDDDANSVATIRRSQQFSVKGDLVSAVGEATLRVNHLKDASVGAQLVENPQLWVNQLLPKKLFPYFIFNGEESANYFAQNSQQEIRDTILRIARVDVLQRMKMHLGKVRDEIAAEMKKADPGNLATVDGEVQLRRSSVENLKAEVDAMDQELRTFDVQNANLKERVEKSGRIKAKMDELTELDADSAVLREQLKSENEKLAMWVATNAQFYFGAKALLDMRTSIKKAKDKGSFPPAFKPEPLLKLIEDGACICGQELSAGGSAIAHIENLIEEYRVAGPRGVELQKISVHLEAFFERQADSKPAYEAHIKIVKSILEDIQAKANRAAELKLEVGEDAALDEAKLFEQLLAQLEARGRAATNLALKISEYEQEKVVLAAAELEYERMLKKSDVAMNLRMQFVFIGEALEKIEVVYERILQGVLEQVGGKLNSNFQTWHSKDNPETIKLGEDFTISKIGNFGQPTSFSKGEYRLLYYSLCFAARAVSGFKLPLIVDSPWGNMDNTTRTILSNVISEKTDERQTVILVLDSEYPPELAQIMSAGRPRHFAIKMHSGVDEKYSTIEEVK